MICLLSLNNHIRIHGLLSHSTPELSVLPRDSCVEALTDEVKSSPLHSEILGEICFVEVIHITIPPLLAQTLHPQTLS